MEFANTIPAESDLVLDDDGLLADRLLRSLHKNEDGHLASSNRMHSKEVLPLHNVAILYCYSIDDGEYSLYQLHFHSAESLSYREWRRVARDAAENLERTSGDNFYGVYGWNTAFISITPLRTGDVFLTVDKKGVRGVRLSFGARKTNGKARHETKSPRR